MASKAATQALQAKEKVMQDEIEKFRKLQKGQSAGEGERGGLALIRIHPPFADMQKYTASRMQLDTQLNENKTVKEVLFSGEYPPFLVYSGNYSGHPWTKNSVPNGELSYFRVKMYTIIMFEKH